MLKGRVGQGSVRLIDFTPGFKGETIKGIARDKKYFELFKKDH